jgi:hypothetical protein
MITVSQRGFDADSNLCNNSSANPDVCRFLHQETLTMSQRAGYTNFNVNFYYFFRNPII